MTVVLSYTAGSSKLFMGVTSIEETDDLIVVSYGSGTEIVPRCRIRELRVSLG